MYIRTTYKKHALIAAKELNYGRDVVNKIRSTNNESEIARIMLTARRKSMVK